MILTLRPRQSALTGPQRQDHRFRPLGAYRATPAPMPRGAPVITAVPPRNSAWASSCPCSPPPVRAAPPPPRHVPDGGAGGPAAVHRELGAGDVGGGVGEEEDDGLGDLPGLADPA